MHRVQNLTDGCHGEVTAIEYCYRYYHSPELGDAAFNWTVLFFIEEGERLKITRIDNIESRPNSLPKSDCQIDIPGTVKCCNREIITSFDLGPHMNGFIFGVTEAAHGNTRNAALVGFHSSLLEYNIDTMIVSKAGLQNNISVGYTLPRTSGGQTLGLQMMWFVIGKSADTIIN